mmetsp:Transcript_12946/g.15810  ORF Transcript_12946/g.15810 Transcript_12946/m.15810 type:complete len:519 (+) Transcript_12946:243-1799(+)
MSSKSFLSFYCVQLFSASVSLICSSFIAGGIIRSDGGLTSPFRRIIFGVSVSDILQSLSLIVGPFAVPAETPVAVWAVGNSISCKMDGFFYCFAAGTTPMYMFGLCVYTYFKINRNMSDRAFAYKVERVMHILIILLSSGFVALGLVTKAINSTVIGSFCTYAAFPTACRQIPSLECDQTIDKYVFPLGFISTIGLPFTCLFGIIFSMTAVCLHMLRRTFKFSGQLRGEESSPPTSQADQDSSSSQADVAFPVTMANDASPTKSLIEEGSSPPTPTPLEKIDEIQACNNSTMSAAQEADRSQLQIQAQNLILVYRREVIIQALSFVLAFIATFILWWVANVQLILLETQPSTVLAKFATALYPLGGFFNALVYIRPKIMKLRIGHPEYSWLRAMWIIIKTGGSPPVASNVAEVDQETRASAGILPLYSSLPDLTAGRLSSAEREILARADDWTPLSSRQISLFGLSSEADITIVDNGDDGESDKEKCVENEECQTTTMTGITLSGMIGLSDNRVGNET